MKLLFSEYNKKAIYIGIFFIIAITLICLIFQRSARVSFSFMETSFFGGSATETQVQFGDGESYIMDTIYLKVGLAYYLTITEREGKE